MKFPKYTDKERDTLAALAAILALVIIAGHFAQQKKNKNQGVGNTTNTPYGG